MPFIATCVDAIGTVFSDHPHRVKTIGQITTSRVSWKGCNKFRVKSQKVQTYIQRQSIVVRPWKLVIPVPDKVQNPPSKSRHTLIIRQRRRTPQTVQESRKQPKDNKL